MSAISVDKAQFMARDHGEWYSHAEKESCDAEKVIVDIGLEDENQVSFSWIDEKGNVCALYIPDQRLRQLLEIE